MKKLLAMVLAMAMMMALGSAAFADGAFKVGSSGPLWHIGYECSKNSDRRDQC